MSFRIFGKSGLKAPSGVIAKKIEGSQAIEAELAPSGDTGFIKLNNNRTIVSVGDEDTAADPFVVASKDSSVRDLADVGSGSNTGLETISNGEDLAYHSKMNTDIEVKKPKDNIYY